MCFATEKLHYLSKEKQICANLKCFNHHDYPKMAVRLNEMQHVQGEAMSAQYTLSYMHVKRGMHNTEPIAQGDRDDTDGIDTFTALHRCEFIL